MKKENKYEHYNKKDVVLFINADDGSLKNYEAKKQILISYCEEKNYNIVDIIKYEEDEDDCRFYKTKLDLILKHLNKFDDLVIYDMKELSDYAEILYVILEMLADNYIRVESLCDGRYFGLCNSDIEFEVRLRENIPSLADKLKKIVD